jgi:hypothetical protein
MYELKQKREPAWLTLREAAGEDPAVEILAAPHSRSLKRKALAAARALIELPDDLREATPEQLQDFAEALTRETIRRAILDWRGIGNAAGEPAAATPEAIELFLDDEELLDAADRAYLVPAAARDAEKNALPPSPNGISEGAQAIAPAAPRRTRSAAKQNAPTSPRRRKPSRARKSGTS